MLGKWLKICTLLITHHMKSKFKYFAVLLLLFIIGCSDSYRYECQNPKNFALKKCQRPDCLFSQDCPDYLVAPVLEKQIVPPPQVPTPTASDAR